MNDKEESEPLEIVEPGADLNTWELSDDERRIYEAGFMAGYFARDPEVANLDHEADRLYQIAFDHRNCSCWKGHHHP
jgi:hypothetical protein